VGPPTLLDDRRPLTDTSTGNHVMLQVDVSRVNDSSISSQAPFQEQLGTSD
jgi:hypothetical protein